MHHPNSAYYLVFRVSRPGLQGLQAEKAANRGLLVPATEKIPHLGAYKYLIWLTLVRCGGVGLAVRHRRSAANVPQLCRLAALQSRDGAVRLHLEIG